MDQKDYRRLISEGVIQPLLINMVMEGMIDEFELEEDPDDDQLTIIKLRTDRPKELEDVTIEEVEAARKEEEEADMKD